MNAKYTKIAVMVCMALLFLILPACSNEQDDAGLYEVEWLDTGIDSGAVRFGYYGENMYLIEAETDGIFRYGFLNDEGEVVIPIIYEKASGFRDGLCFVELDGKKMFIDNSGREILDVSEYYTAYGFEFGFATVVRETFSATESGFSYAYAFGLIDTKGEEIIPCEYAETGSFGNGVIWARQFDDEFIIFSSAGQRLTYGFTYVADAGEGLLAAERGGKIGYIDRDGKTVIPFKYEEAGGFFDGVAIVTEIRGGLYSSYYINTSGERLSEIEFDELFEFSDGLGMVILDLMYGFMDANGELVVPCEYDKAYDFYNGLAVVVSKIGASSFYNTIDKNGNIAIVPKEQGYYKWKDSYVMYYNPDELGDADADFEQIALLSDAGKRLTDFIYTDIEKFDGGVAVAEFFGEETQVYGIINQNGAEIVPVIFDKIEPLGAGKFIVLASTFGSGENSTIGLLTLVGNAATRKP